MLKFINFQKFFSSKSPVSMEGIDVNKMLTSEGLPDGKTGKNGKKKNFKYFISHKNDEQVVHQAPTNERISKWLQLLKKYNKIRDKMSKGDENRVYLTSLLILK